MSLTRLSPSQVERTCKICGTIFFLYQNELNKDDRTGQFCSLPCSQEGRKTGYETPCEYCSRLFWVVPHMVAIGVGKFCSRACAGKSRNTQIEQTCPQCGTIFFVVRARLEGKQKVFYCSPPCWYASNTKSLAERFWAKVDLNGPIPPHRPELGPCWLWTGARFKPPREYGLLGNVNGKTRLAHRLVWELCDGPIPTGFEVCHHCDNPPCVRWPEHLFLGTQKDNIQDMISKGRDAPLRDSRNHQQGEQHGYAKFSLKQIQEMRTRYAAGGISQEALAKEYDTTQSHIGRIVRYENWRV